MLGQRDSCMGIAAPAYEKELQERYKRSVWDDLIFAIQLLKNFDEEEFTTVSTSISMP